MLSSSPLAQLEDQVRKARRRLHVAAATLAGAMVLLDLLALAAFPARTAGLTWALSALGLLGAVALAAFASLDPRGARALDLLRARPNSVVWIYVREFGRTGADLVLGLDDGSQEHLPIELLRRDELIAMAGALAPLATLGFSPQHQHSFLRDPASLRRYLAS